LNYGIINLTYERWELNYEPINSTFGSELLIFNSLLSLIVVIF
jgi:hypothetical protein